MSSLCPKPKSMKKLLSLIDYLLRKRFIDAELWFKLNVIGCSTVTHGCNLVMPTHSWMEVDVSSPPGLVWTVMGTRLEELSWRGGCTALQPSASVWGCASVFCGESRPWSRAGHSVWGEAILKGKNKESCLYMSESPLNANYRMLT